MKIPVCRSGLASTLVVLAVVAMVSAQQRPESSALRLVASTSLPGNSGDFDHFAADELGNRLFLAGEDQKTLEVFDLKTAHHIRSIGGFGAPHSIFFLPESNRILVTDGGAGAVQILNGTDYSFVE